MPSREHHYSDHINVSESSDVRVESSDVRDYAGFCRES
jgi:hypothetical protein